ncbi:hypothetical protein [Nocardia wallacei]|uniref:hypothetical protein n=1 Tax=Nocardia wallacei TaxID=480035 RepID=UPI002456F855|nr:hypothetical protein [Nocardia wallacei]
MTATRAEHIAWCRTRALAELDDDSDGLARVRAVNSMANDLMKHPEIRASAASSMFGSAPVAVELAALEMVAGTGLRTVAEVRTWIEGIS